MEAGRFPFSGDRETGLAKEVVCVTWSPLTKFYCTQCIFHLRHYMTLISLARVPLVQIVPGQIEISHLCISIPAKVPYCFGRPYIAHYLYAIIAPVIDC